MIYLFANYISSFVSLLNMHLFIYMHTHIILSGMHSKTSESWPIKILAQESCLAWETSILKLFSICFLARGRKIEECRGEVLLIDWLEPWFRIRLLPFQKRTKIWLEFLQPCGIIEHGVCVNTKQSSMWIFLETVWLSSIICTGDSWDFTPKRIDS